MRGRVWMCVDVREATGTKQHERGRMHASHVNGLCSLHYFSHSLAVCSTYVVGDSLDSLHSASFLSLLKWSMACVCARA